MKVYISAPLTIFFDFDDCHYFDIDYLNVNSLDLDSYPFMYDWNFVTLFNLCWNSKINFPYCLVKFIFIIIIADEFLIYIILF